MKKGGGSWIGKQVDLLEATLTLEFSAFLVPLQHLVLAARVAPSSCTRTSLSSPVDYELYEGKNHVYNIPNI